MDTVAITSLLIMGACMGVLIFIGILVWAINRQLGY